MSKGILISILLTVLSVVANAQYFQQDVAYTIRVKLDDKNHILRGDEEVVYTNNSPDTLSFVYFHLWPNAYENKQTALAKQLVNIGETSMYFAEPKDLGYIDSLSFALNGKLCLWEYDSEHRDICKIYFEEPLKPGSSVTISTPFKVKIPSGEISRLGHIGESYQITQWYPKPAVYDTAGWHPMPYLTIGEFYSEFGSFDVFIDVPSNYVVGATGDLQTRSEVLWLNDQVEKTEAWIRAREDANDWSNLSDSLQFPESSKTYKTLHFSQSKVHDFAWFADKRYHVLRDSVELPHSKREVAVWTMFTNKRARLWSNSLEYMKDAVYYYSLWNGDYPYDHATAVDGTISAGGGMEYPNITVIGDAGDALSLETVIVHEVGHNWFYGILGSNERQYPYLDEGLNSYNEQRYLGTKYPNGHLLSKNESNPLFKFAGLDYYGIDEQHKLTYLIMARTNRDQPMNIPAPEYSFLNYGFVVYSKSAATFDYLRHYLSDSIMDAAMQRYFEENKFKHPYPNSLEQAIEKESGQDLDWFFRDVIGTNGKVDYAIKKVKTSSEQTSVSLKNRGLKVPVHVALLDDDKNILESRWISGFETDTTIQFNAHGDYVSIDPDRKMPEFIRDNNQSKTKGSFKKVEPVELKFLGAVEKPTLNQVFYTPILGWNIPNGFMPGLALYNITLPTRRFTYVLAPMFSTRATNLVGTGALGYSIQPLQGPLENIEITLSGKRYAYNWTAGHDFRYSRINPHATFYVRPNNYQGLVQQKFTLGSVVNLREQPSAGPKGIVKYVQTTELFNRVNYNFLYNHPVFKTNLIGRIEQNTDFLRTSIELTERINLDKRFRLSLRGFAGTFLANNTTSARYNWRMDGQNAATDYAFDGEFFDRSQVDGFLNRQFMANHGAFKVPTAVGQSTSWIASVNLKARFGKIPIGIFTDVGFSPTETAMADAGIYLVIVPELVEVYLPLLYTRSIENEIVVNGLEWHDLIRFNLALDKLNLIESAKRLQL
ncbi:MAG: hypothetical protein Salg2KO_02510 [Salibacteraceae bacterium]